MHHDTHTDEAKEINCLLQTSTSMKVFFQEDHGWQLADFVEMGRFHLDNLVAWKMINQEMWTLTKNRNTEIPKKKKAFNVDNIWGFWWSPRPYNPHFLSPLTSPSWYETSIDTCPEAWNCGGISGSPSKNWFQWLGLSHTFLAVFSSHVAILYTISSFRTLRNLLGCPRKLGSMVRKWVITPIYSICKQVITVITHLLTIC